MRVLIVEDEDAIAEPLAEGLRREGFDVTRVATGEEALTAGADAELVLLDVRLPDVDGFTVCRELRARSDVPIIMVTAKGEEIDRVVGLELGADDYVVKPFGVRELVARIRAVTRRTTRRDGGTHLAAGPVAIDTRARSVAVDGRSVELTPKEYDLLVALVAAEGAVVSKQRLLQDVWGGSWLGAGKTVDVHVASLRRKVGDPDVVQTVRGVGLRIRA
ncbi:MAG TPA: response regulator transcription factor [Gaiella sp.]|nr:response regulator transcription factor [Gaiella sp.]